MSAVLPVRGLTDTAGSVTGLFGWTVLIPTHAGAVLLFYDGLAMAWSSAKPVSKAALAALGSLTGLSDTGAHSMSAMHAQPRGVQVASAAVAAAADDPMCASVEGEVDEVAQSKARGNGTSADYRADPVNENIVLPLRLTSELYTVEAAECFVATEFQPHLLKATHFTINSNIISGATLSLEKVLQHRGALLERGPGRELERMRPGTSIRLFLYVKMTGKSFYVGMSTETIAGPGAGDVSGVLRQDGSNLLAFQPASVKVQLLGAA